MPQALQFDEQAVLRLARQHYGERVAGLVEDWLMMLVANQSIPEREMLTMVNDFWNSRVRGDDDIRIWGKTDYWATPVETLSKGAGDCEDFVIAKYFSLVRMGVDPDKLRFIYVRARTGPMGSTDTVAHMVLGYYSAPDSEPLLLDNLNGIIYPASRRSDLMPVFSFNASGIYVPGSARTESVERIGHWRDLLARMHKEGFTP